MKRLIAVLLSLLMILTLASCSGDKEQPILPESTAQPRKSGEGDKEHSSPENQPGSDGKAGVAPLKLSESEIKLLSSFGIDSGGSLIVSFIAPEETETVEVRIYTLREGGSWERTSATNISSGGQKIPGGLEGTFTMRFLDNYAARLVLSWGFGGFSSKTEGVDSGGKNVASTYGFLQEYKQIELDKEIPLAVMAYSFFDEGTSMTGIKPEDYFTPSVFEGADLVRAVTLVFSR